ncbi:MAG: hypothetical protein DHS20C20_16800 [Ardenticatenaceae bacterium]|nr:MAG: hypothetical protein DHS20C20_16800 [Ardenticatenaceae bacterium]
MRFLANENFPLASVNNLKDAGHVVASVSEIMPGAKDEDVLKYAQREAQIILTFDRDYGELIFRHKLPNPAGILYLRFFPQTPEESAEYISNLLSNSKITLEGKFTVARRDRIRQRPLP